MLKDIITNASLMVSFIFTIGLFYNRRKIDYPRTFRERACWGLMYAFFGCLLMLFSIRATDTVIVDLRQLAIVMAAMHGGWVAAVISASGILLFRMFYFGVTDAAIVAGGFTVLIGVVCGLLSLTSLGPFRKLNLMNVVAAAIATTAMWINIGDAEIVRRFALYIWPTQLAAGAAVYCIARFVITANVTHNRLMRNERELSETATMLHILMDNIPSGIMVESEQRKIIYVNREFTRMFGIDVEPDKLIGSDCSGWLSSQKHIYAEPEQFISRTEQMINDKTPVKIEIFELSDGRIFQRDYIPIVMDGEYAGHMWEYTDITDAKLAEKRLQEANTVLKRLSEVDGLTGLANRRSLDAELQFEWETCRRRRQPLSVLMLDVDHFKLYNDTYGHLKGDECLRKIAETLEACLNQPEDFAARYGGEEFAALLPFTAREDAVKIARRIRKRIEALRIPHESSPTSNVVTVSIGVYTVVPRDDLEPLHVMNRADSALYAAKYEGRNTVYASDVATRK
ncbi:diguanylate cyclase domain-containing protein [Paenibacillus alkalitolerans]|uniref:diguanylate cyclase domain-containing protein n=1 Tax=Paenibacillus alkalitolerans TaxID=2799335 RepID=UPI0018F37ED4|nr:diguanylate cyclase [Paenibacillus alkalitolerans]